MSFGSPNDRNGNQSGGSGSDRGQSDNGRNAFSASLSFLKGLTEKKNTRGDGQPSKRRGPKPDSKPAMTRRQELNRQAQRTHRERKELYLKALEVEVLELKQRFSSVQNDKDTLAEENIQLKQLLTQHGIAWVSTGGVETFTQNNPSGPSSNGTTSISVPGSQGLDTFSTSHVTPGIMPRNGGQLQQHAQNMPPLDYDQAGIDFVLTLERPCMDHLQVVLEGSEASGEFEFGHALLASCPPDIYDGTNLQIPPGHGPGNSPSGHKQWDISQGDLANLLDLSKRLNLDGEVTPVMAWGMILDHPRFPELTAPDLEMLTETMRGKTGCYGFGAVLEEFEVRDALHSILSMRAGANAS